MIDADLIEEFKIECLDLADVRDLSAGIVPLRVQSVALRLLDFEDLIRRNAEKPDRTKKR